MKTLKASITASQKDVETLRQLSKKRPKLQQHIDSIRTTLDTFADEIADQIATNIRDRLMDVVQKSAAENLNIGNDSSYYLLIFEPNGRKELVEYISENLHDYFQTKAFYTAFSTVDTEGTWISRFKDISKTLQAAVAAFAKDLNEGGVRRLKATPNREFDFQAFQADCQNHLKGTINQVTNLSFGSLYKIVTSKIRWREAYRIMVESNPITGDRIPIMENRRIRSRKRAIKYSICKALRKKFEIEGYSIRRKIRDQILETFKSAADTYEKKLDAEIDRWAERLRDKRLTKRADINRASIEARRLETINTRLNEISQEIQQIVSAGQTTTDQQHDPSEEPEPQDAE